MGDVTLQEGGEASVRQWGWPNQGDPDLTPAGGGYVLEVWQVLVTYGQTGQADWEVGTRSLVSEWQSWAWPERKWAGR